MSPHSSVDISMPSACASHSSPSSEEILARFEAEQQQRNASPPLLAWSMAGFSLVILMLGGLSMRSGASSPLQINPATPPTATPPTATPPTAMSWNSSFEAAKQQASASGQPMMLEFSTDWCGVCHRMDATTFTDPAVIAQAQSVIPVRINAETRTDLARQFGINSYPTFVWLDSAGRERARTSGGYEAAAFLALMQQNR